MKAAKVKLSQCMIVKNEEQNIQRALSWGKDFVYEQIVVDTGSTDCTVQLAEEMGASVYHFEWIDDFSAAKNYALSKATGNWIAFLDADEYFSPEEAEKVIPLLNQLHFDQRIDVISMNMAHLNDDGKVAAVAPQQRFFRNDPKLRYRYRIHEELYHKKKKRLGCYDAIEQLIILHSGYGEKNRRGTEKGERNIRLLKKQLQETPNDGKCLMYLGDAYVMADEEEKAKSCYRRVLNDSKVNTTDGIAILRSGMQLLNVLGNEADQEAEKEFRQVCMKLRTDGFDYHPDLDYAEGIFFLKKGDIKQAAVFFEHALKKMETYRGTDAVRMTANLELVCNTIAQAAMQQGDSQKTVQFAVTALRTNKYSPDGITSLLNAFLTEWKSGMHVDSYWDFLCKIYDRENLKDLLFLYKFTQETGFVDLEKLIWDEIPGEAKQYL